MTTEQTACILCSRNCGLRVEIEDEARITGVRGDPAHPVSKGYVCQKAARLAFYQAHTDRLEHPLRREPDGSFVRVGWDEALADIARRLLEIRKRHGGRTFAFYGGGGPAINYYNFDEDRGSNTEGGLTLLAGLEHDEGLFLEVKFGAWDSPDLKLGVGYVFGK